MAETERRTFPLELVLTPEGFFPELRQPTEEGRALLERWRADRWAALYRLGVEERPEGLSPSALYLVTAAESFFRALTSLPELELARERAEVPLSEEEADRLLRAAPFAAGAEYVDRAWLEGLFRRLNEVFAREIKAYDGTAAFYLAGLNQNLRAPERVFFHIVESKDEEFPFAFLATYATRGENGAITHVPLQYALTEYGADRSRLLELLSCLNRAAEISPLIGGFMETGELFHPLKLTAEETFALLKRTEAPVYAAEAAGRDLVLRLPEAAGRLEALELCRPLSLGDVSVTAFPTSHDAPGACGFRFDTPGGAVGLMTDTGYVTEAAEEVLPGVALAVLEANHDVETLRSGPYPYCLKRRILGDGGHLSNEDCARFAVTLAEHGAAEIVLAHLSRENNTPAMARRAVETALSAAGLHPALSVTPRDALGEAHVVREVSRCRG